MSNVLKDIPFRGSFDPTTQPFIAVAYADTSIFDKDSPNFYKNSKGWYILTSSVYGLPQTSDSDSEEAIFTPFFSGKWDPNQSGTFTNSFLQIYNCDFTLTPKTCQLQTDSQVWLPQFVNWPFDYNPYVIKNVQPMIMKAKNVGLGAWQFDRVKGNDVQRLNTDITNPSEYLGNDFYGNSPYQAATFIKKNGATVDRNTTYLLSPQSQLDTNAVISKTRIFAGYPYRLVSRDDNNNGAFADDVFPFRDFYATELTTDKGKIYPGTGSQTKLGNQNLGIASFRGFYYQNDPKKLATQDVKGPTGQRIFNFGNQPVNTANRGGDTVQVYFLPLNYFSSSAGQSCPSVGGILPLLSDFFNYIYPQTYEGNCNADPLRRPSYCAFTSPQSCKKNDWYNYCLTDLTGCGACFGGCNLASSSQPYCAFNPDYSSTNPNVFACTESVDPEDPMFPKAPPGPPGPPSSGGNAVTGWVVSASIFFVVILICVIIVLKFK